MSLTKQEVVEEVGVQLGYSRRQPLNIVELLLETIKSTLASGDDVLVSGFGKLCVKDKAQRRGRNPATGEAAILPTRRVVTFRCARRLRDHINKK